MSDLPERIWALPKGAWFATLATNECTEYVRADTITALTAERDAAIADMAAARNGHTNGLQNRLEEITAELSASSALNKQLVAKNEKFVALLLEPTAGMLLAALESVSDVTVRNPKATAWDSLRAMKAMVKVALKETP